MGIPEIQSYVRAMEKNLSLYEETNLGIRNDVIDFIGFQLFENMEELRLTTDEPGKLMLLKHRAEKIKSRLEAIDDKLFRKLQATIRTEGYTGTAFKNLVNEYVGFTSTHDEHGGEAGYGSLDIFINGLSCIRGKPEPTRDLEPDMVYYQKTPARIVFELVEQAHFTKEDVFFDLGAGLGQVAMLVHLLTGMTTRGIEFEPAFCHYARDCAAMLNLHKVTFINADARNADYSEGTVFFMFTPFRGEILREVLELLRKESLRRKIKIITYGPCTTQVALQSWLTSAVPGDNNIYKPCIFDSIK